MSKETESRVCLVEFEGKMWQQESHPPPSSQASTSDWMFPIIVKLGIISERSTKLSIYRVPNKLGNVKKEAYTPGIVSIGPFHKGKRELLAMEEHKWRYMLSFVHRTSHPEKTLEKCGQAVMNLGEQARGCYAENIKFNKNELAEIILVDDCFILELFLRRSLGDFVDHSDPILNNAWMIAALQHDLALLENQIPFLVLENLFEIVFPLVRINLRSHSFFFHADLGLNQGIIRGSSIHSSEHLLDLLHKIYLPTSLVADFQGKDNRGFRHCASELLEAGIQFEKSPTTEGHLLDVRFSNGVITIPDVCRYNNRIAPQKPDCF